MVEDTIESCCLCKTMGVKYCTHFVNREILTMKVLLTCQYIQEIFLIFSSYFCTSPIVTVLHAFALSYVPRFLFITSHCVYSCIFVDHFLLAIFCLAQIIRGHIMFGLSVCPFLGPYVYMLQLSYLISVAYLFMYFQAIYGLSCVCLIVILALQLMSDIAVTVCVCFFRPYFQQLEHCLALSMMFHKDSLIIVRIQFNRVSSLCSFYTCVGLSNKLVP